MVPALLAALIAVGVAALAPAAGAAPPARVAVPALSVRVQGNTLVDGSGNPIRLLGVDRSGTEYACDQGWGIFDGPSDATSIAAMASWHINAVRIPLNEDCWLGINGVAANVSGAAYQAAVGSYVAALHAAGLYAILELAINAPGTTLATNEQVMADADHSPAFWTSVADYFSTDHAVLFDLYNEPNNISWSCWLNGCTTPGGWQSAGMQQMVNAVRATGATQPVMLGGLAYSNDLSSWLANRPTDPDNQEVASFHVYNFNTCSTVACWNSSVAPVAAVVPVVTGEVGENDCAAGFIDSYMAWADAHGVSYLGWTWDATDGGSWTCTGGPSLITDYDGTPTQTYGAGYQAHLAALAAAGPATFAYPISGQTGVDTTQAFTWAASPAAQAYFLVVGTTKFATNLVDSGVLPATDTSYAVPDLPAGTTLYATLLTEIADAWQYQSVTFTAAPGRATLTYPVNGQLNVATNKPFTWATIPAGQGYILVIGTTVFGTNLYSSGILPASQSSVTVPSLPTGKVLFATLLTEVNGAYTRYQLIAFTAS